MANLTYNKPTFLLLPQSFAFTLRYSHEEILYIHNSKLLISEGIANDSIKKIIGKDLGQERQRGLNRFDVKGGV